MSRSVDSLYGNAHVVHIYMPLIVSNSADPLASPTTHHRARIRLYFYPIFLIEALLNKKIPLCVCGGQPLAWLRDSCKWRK
jgi:hypothetical protein